MDNLYKRIESLCKMKNVNITQMCRETNISRSPLNSLKQGITQKLSSDKLQRIAEYFGVTVDYLLAGDAVSTPNIAHYPEEVRIRSFLETASAEEIQSLIKYVEFLESQRK